MLSVVEKIISLVAPHYCIGCGAEGAVVCAWCLPDFALPLPERCYICRSVGSGSLVCRKCRRSSRLKHVWVRTGYAAAAKQLVHEFKFERKRAAAEPIAHMMTECLPFLPANTLVTHVPTATSRVRRRGYDHAELLAMSLARELGLRHETLLGRVTQTRQVRSKRVERLAQMQSAFRVVHPEKVQKSVVLLVDDLVTTGATIESAAKCLREAGAKLVDATVFAQKQ